MRICGKWRANPTTQANRRASTSSTCDVVCLLNVSENHLNLAAVSKNFRLACLLAARPNTAWPLNRLPWARSIPAYNAKWPSRRAITRAIEPRYTRSGAIPFMSASFTVINLGEMGSYSKSSRRAHHSAHDADADFDSADAICRLVNAESTIALF